MTARGAALFAAVGALLAGCLSWHPGALPGEPADATFAQLGEVRLHYVDVRPRQAPAPDAGESVGAPRGTIVLLHGFGASSGEWGLLVPVLADAGYRVIAPDLLGHGWSSRPDADYSIAAQAHRVLALAEALGVAHFDVVGHSWGSAVALDVVRQAPERVRRVALYNGLFFQDQRPALFGWVRAAGMGELVVGAFYVERLEDKLAWAFFDPERALTQTAVERAEAELARPGTRAAALAGLRALDLAELERTYSGLTQPVLLVWGREDAITPLEYGERLANQLRDARLVVVPRCGHVPMVEVPHASSAALLRFLEEDAP
jgi:haloalkane dehalogenase